MCWDSKSCRLIFPTGTAPALFSFCLTQKKGIVPASSCRPSRRKTAFVCGLGFPFSVFPHRHRSRALFLLLDPEKRHRAGFKLSPLPKTPATSSGGFRLSLFCR